VDDAIATLGALRVVACPLDHETPLRQRAIVVGFDALRRGERGLDTKWRERGEHGTRHRFVDLSGADAEAVDAATIDDALAGAVIARRRGAAGVVRAQPACATCVRIGRRRPAPAAGRFPPSRRRHLIDAVADGCWP